MHAKINPKTQTNSLSLNQILWFNKICFLFNFFLIAFFFFLVCIHVAANCCSPHCSDNMREAAVVLSVPGHKGPVVGPEQLSSTRAAQAILLLQVHSEAYLQVFVPKQTAHRCRDIYSTGSICFTNIDKKWLVWQQYLAGNFGFALHIPL